MQSFNLSSVFIDSYFLLSVLYCVENPILNLFLIWFSQPYFASAIHCKKNYSQLLSSFWLSSQ